MGNFTETEKVYDWGKEAVNHCSVVTELLLKLMKVLRQQGPKLHNFVNAVTANELYA